jgi:small subunit ribosomal protein S6
LRTYETVFVVGGNTPDEDIQKIISQLESVITDKGGKVTKVDTTTLGRRKLAYTIRKGHTKFDDGAYTIIFSEGDGHDIAEVERRLRVNDLVIRHLVVRTDEDLKRAEKMKSRRKVVAAAPGATEDADDNDGDDADEFDS